MKKSNDFEFPRHSCNPSTILRPELPPAAAPAFLSLYLGLHTAAAAALEAKEPPNIKLGQRPMPTSAPEGYQELSQDSVPPVHKNVTNS
jgi:hypothetical protein